MPVSRRQTSSAVSPLSQAILHRENTIALQETLQNAARVAYTKPDAKMLMKRDTKTTWRGALLGVWDLVSQYRIGALMILHAVVILLHTRFNWGASSGFGSIDILGWVVGLLVTFRQNQAMLRFWEARTAWGKLATACREVVRSVISQNNNKDTSMAIAMYTISFAVTLKNLLRGEPDSCDKEELAMLLSEHDLEFVMAQKNLDRPIAILDLLSAGLMQCVNDGTLDQSTVQLVLDGKIAQMNDALGTSHRIKTTPLPVVYRMTLDIAQTSFLILLPFSFLAMSWSPVASFLICCIVNLVLNALAKLGGQLEDPFGKDLNDLPLGMITANIMKEVLHITHRWYKPNSILFNSKMRQQKQFELEQKLKRAQVKALVLSSFKRGTQVKKDRTEKSSLQATINSLQTSNLLGKVYAQYSLSDLAPLESLVEMSDEDEDRRSEASATTPTTQKNPSNLEDDESDECDVGDLTSCTPYQTCSNQTGVSEAEALDYEHRDDIPHIPPHIAEA